MKGKINIKIIVYLLFIGFMLVGTFGAITFYYYSVKDIVEEQSYHFLEAIAHSRAEHIQDFILEADRESNMIANDHHFKDFLMKRANPAMQLEHAPTEKHLQEVLNGYMLEHIYEIFILDVEGKVAITTNPEEEEGEDFSEEELFLEAKEKAYATFGIDEEFDRIGMVVSSQIFNEERLIGVIVLRLSTETLYEIAQDRIGLGETGEIYLINREGYMLTPGRFEDEVDLKRKIETENSEECLEDLREGEEEEREKETVEHIRIFESYEGSKTIGTGVPLYELDVCLLAEYSEREILQLLKNELIKSGLLVLIGISVLIGIFVIVVNRFLLGRGKKR